MSRELSHRSSPLSRRLAAAIFAVLAVAILVALIGSVRCGSQPARTAVSQADDSSITTGYVFLDGAYLAPPYAVRATADGTVTLNGRTVWAPDTADVLDEAAARPAAARSAAEAAAADAGEWFDSTWPERADRAPARFVDELKRRLAGSAGVVSVRDDGYTAFVTDTAGQVAGVPYYQPPIGLSVDPAVRAATKAAEIERALRDGDVVLVSSGIEVEVPGERAERFLADLAGSFRGGPGRAAELLGRMLPPALAVDVLAAGSPEAALRARIPGLEPTEPQVRNSYASPVSPVELEVVNGRAQAQLAAFPDGHVPGADTAIFWMVHDRDISPVKDAVKLHHYDITEYNRDWFGGAKKLIAKDFIWALGHAGVFYIHSHGSPEAIEIDRYRCKTKGWFCSDNATTASEEFNKALPNAQYNPTYVAESPTGAIAVGGKEVGLPSYTGVYLSYAGIVWASEKAAADGGSKPILLELASCSAIGLAGGFKTADDVVGGNETLYTSVQDDDIGDFDKAFWPRMSGVKDSGAKRWVSAAYAAIDASKFAHRGSGLTMLSPVVSSVSPVRGAEVPVGAVIDVKVRFNMAMDNRYTDASMEIVRFEGDCSPEKQYAHTNNTTKMDSWTDDHTIIDQVKTRHEGTLRVRVSGTRAPAAANRVDLDGNDGKDGGTSGVGANQDDFVWEFKCSAKAVTEAPAKVTTPAAQQPGTTGGTTGVVIGGQTKTTSPEPPKTPTANPTGTPTTTPTAGAPTNPTTTPTTGGTETTTPTPKTTTTPTPPSPSPTQVALVTGSYSGNVSVVDDPAGHAPFIKPSTAWTVRQERDTTTGVITITLGGILPGISLSTTISGTGAAFNAAAMGAVAGYKNVAVAFNGTVTPTGGVNGSLVVGGNGALPTGKAITFGVKLAKQQ